MSDTKVLPATDCDLLTGTDQIASWFGLSKGQCQTRINDGEILTFKLYPKTTTYALKSENMEFWKTVAREYRNKHVPAD
jgi:hypothetical protein